MQSFMVLVTASTDCHLCYGPFTSEVNAAVWAGNHWPTEPERQRRTDRVWKVIPQLSPDIR